MERITLTINTWSNDQLKDIKKKDYVKCEKDIVAELGVLMIHHSDDKLSKNDYRWLLLEELSEKHLLNSIHMIMLFNQMYFDDFFEYTEEELKKMCEEYNEELEASTNE